ncbi:hypothetical protein Cni_G10946 [Canna indica]|uniref:Uncharacterized protein n=1 Tax=Canna indica TaxID=4628 RepID=A0AAQ3K553_9LILI|nr:hypothetical protein Cni_G10946 [Canna indica]
MNWIPGQVSVAYRQQCSIFALLSKEQVPQYVYFELCQLEARPDADRESSAEAIPDVDQLTDQIRPSNFVTAASANGYVEQLSHPSKPSGLAHLLVPDLDSVLNHTRRLRDRLPRSLSGLNRSLHLL